MKSIPTSKPTRFLTIALALASVSSVPADVILSKLFGDHMVLQQNQPIRIWGQAEPGEQVTAELAGKSNSVKAGADRRWRIDLPPMKADGKAHSLIIKGNNTITLNDVLFGEVWICSGQSNMEWPLNKILNGQQEVAAATHPQIRLFNVPGHVSVPEPLDDPRGQWQVCSPEAVPGFSAVGYLFGRELQQQLKVPIGLVGTNWGGTRIEPWTPSDGFRAVPQLKDIVDTLDAPKPPTAEPAPAKKRGKGKPGGGGPTEIYNGMVHALTPLSARGVIWYQGESNAKDGLRYEYLKEALVKGWRKVFENDDLSFYWVQLANFQGQDTKPAGGGWGPVREGQRRALRLPHTGMAVIIDIGDAKNIHPANKQDVGKRLSLWALAKDYGKNIVHSGPLYKGMQKEGGKIRIQFDHVGSGLMVAQKQGLDPAKETPGADLTHFAIQDAAGEWYWAKAAIDGDSVLVWNDEVKDPAQVRFGYQSNPVGINLYNKEGLPASPFTTD